MFYKSIVFDMLGYDGNKHPQAVLLELGIKYKNAEPCPIADRWIFEDVNVPDYIRLPSFLIAKQ